MPKARPPRPPPPPPPDPDRDDSPETLQRMRDDLVEHFWRMGQQIRRKYEETRTPGMPDYTCQCDICR